MIEKIGWIGSLLLAFSGLPELIRSIYNHRCDLGWGLLIMWSLGEVFALIYTLNKNQKVSLVPLLVNYGLNIIFISGLIYIKLVN
jgi:uncharacterized protein with PQ loop repeat